MAWIEKGAEGVPAYAVYPLLGAALFLGVALPLLRRRRSPEAALSEAPARAELERLLTEIQDLSREHIARLDTKIRLLNQLLLDCDRRQRDLEALLARPLPAAASSPRPPNPLHERIYSLHDAGKDLIEICGATGLEKGEVELILGLRTMPPAA